MSYESDAFCCEIFCLSFNIKHTSKTGLNAQVKKSWSSWDDETDGSFFSISRFTQLQSDEAISCSTQYTKPFYLTTQRTA